MASGAGRRETCRLTAATAPATVPRTAVPTALNVDGLRAGAGLDRRDVALADRFGAFVAFGDLDAVRSDGGWRVALTAGRPRRVLVGAFVRFTFTARLPAAVFPDVCFGTRTSILDPFMACASGDGSPVRSQRVFRLVARPPSACSLVPASLAPRPSTLPPGK